MNLQPCSAARLMSAILEKPLEETFPAAGLKLCPWCDRASMKAEYYPFCNNSCLYQFEHQKVPLECSECGVVKMVGKSLAMARINRNSSGQMYCSKKCQGVWFARTHGFGINPENSGRKWREWGGQCKRGHLWVPENVYVYGKSRQCKICANETSQKRKAAKGG